MVFITRDLPQEAIEAPLMAFVRRASRPPALSGFLVGAASVVATAEPLQGSTGVISGNSDFEISGEPAVLPYNDDG